MTTPSAPADELADDLELALAMADTADSITAVRFQAADLRVTSKPDRTPVTDADTDTEDTLREMLAERRADDRVLGEERGGRDGEGRTWILDPIDGTKNFSRGVPVWATLIALAVDGRPVLGVVSAPALGRRWWASAGGGAWSSDPQRGRRQIAVSGVSELSDACLSTTDLGSWAGAGRLDRYLTLADACWVTRAFGDFWQHVLVAEGALDVAVDDVANAWDLAAPQVIVSEAGGRFTDLAGAARFDGGSGVSSNGLLHDTVLRVLRAG